MGLNILTYAAAKKYVDKTLVGGGALKGKNATIDGITDITGGHRVTFKWTLDDGTVQTNTMDVMDGVDGQDGADGSTPTCTIEEITGGHRVTFTIDGTDETFDVMDGEKGDKGDKGDNAQVTELPEASESEEGKIYQYVGETTASLINGYFYKCVEDSGVYSWVEKSVQSGGGSGGTSDYTELSNKPQIGGTTLIGNKTLAELGIAAASDLAGKVDKVTGKDLSTNDYTNEDKAEVAKVADKADAEDVIDGASYDSTNHLILFKHGSTTLFSLDAAAFVKDGMVDDVEISGGNLVITFNTDAGKQEISIPLTDIFDPANYYDKDDVDGFLADKADKVASATNGDFAGLDANGNLTDSGKKESDFGTADEIADIVNVYGAKNLIPYPFWSNNQASPLYGVSYTINADGSITFSGTSTQVIWFGLCGRINYEYPLSLKAGNYIISCAGLPSEVSSYVGIFEEGNTAPLARATYTDPEGLLELETDKDVFVGFRIPTDFAIDTTIKPMLRMASIKDDTFVPYAKTSRELTVGKAEQSEVTDIVNVYGSKNLLPYPYYDTTKTVNGITFTDNGNGSVTANGTATANANIVLRFRTENVSLKAGRYILTGCPKGGGTAAYSLWLGYNYTTAWEGSVRDTGDGATFSLTSTKVIQLQIEVISGQTVSNLTFYPMLRMASVKDNTYVPYVPTNAKLNEEKMSYADNGVLGAKNLLEITSSTTTINGITFTINADKSVTANGTATANINFRLIPYANIDLSLWTGKPLRLSGCPSGGSNPTYALEIYYNDGEQHWIRDFGDGAELTIPISGLTSLNPNIMIKNGVTVNNLVFKPMVRLASDPDDTYQPYAMTNRELMEKVNVLPREIFVTTDTRTTTTNDANTLPCGFTRMNDVNSNLPTDGTGSPVWYDILTVRQSNDSSKETWGYGFQLAVQTTTNANMGDMYVRAVNGGATPAWSAWRKLN